MKRQYLSKGILCLLVFILSFPLFSQTILLEEHFAGLTTVSYTTNIPATSFDVTGWVESGTNITVAEAGSVTIGKSGSSGSNLTTPTMDMTGGAVTLSFKLKYYGTSSITGSSSSKVYVWLESTSGTQLFKGDKGAVTIPASASAYDAASWTPYTISITGGTSASKIVFAGTSSGYAYMIDDVIVTKASAGPTITVDNSSLSGFIAVQTPSTVSGEQSFTVTGANLTSNATVTPPTGYEISSTSGAGFTSTALTLTPSAGAVSQTIYVRLKGGQAPGAYNGNITISGGGITADVLVSLTGTETAAPLPALSIPTPSAATSENDGGFTSNWTAVANASSYDVKIYDGTTLVKTVNASGQATSTAIVTGLSASTPYTYTVTAIGDAVSYANSAESSSISVTTTAASVPGITGCVFPLYSTDFTDWTAGTGASSTYETITTGAGAGFQWRSSITADPTGTGTLLFSSAYNLNFKPFSFVSGGYVVVRIKNSSTSTRTYALTGSGSDGSIVSTATLVTNLNGTLTPAASITSTGSIILPRETVYDVVYALPSSVSGIKSLFLNAREILESLAVYSAAGASTVVSSNKEDSGMSMSALVGGNTSSMNNLIKGCNLTGPVTMSIVGPDAGRFSLASTTLTLAEASAGINVPVTYTSSVMVGTHNAQLKLSTPGAPDVYVDLVGMSTPASAGPVITTPATPVLLATSVISTATTTIDITGMNLTGDITATITGADAAQFSITPPTTAASIAMGAGGVVTITYQGAITAPITQTANLVLSSPGATSVTIPLNGKTYATPPVKYTLTTIVTPAGTGFITQDIAGTLFPNGTTVKVTAVPEAGYKFVKWTDNNSTALVRSVLMTSNQTVTALFELGSGIVLSPFYAHTPTTINNTSFTARWDALAGATTYTVTVYDETGAVVGTPQTTAALSVSMTGLTQGTLYTYKVVANTGDESNVVGPIKTTGVTAVPACGSVN